jgi:serine/threonine protein kinase
VVVGQTIAGRYRIGSVIGEGGMGVVCAATHLGLGTPVAIKVIRSDLKRDLESVQRFVNEARTAASLKGEHIARVFDVGQLETGEPYLVMEHLEGIGLDAFLLERGPLSQAEAVDIVLQACEGLVEAHAVSLVHRDIKPPNLFLARRPDGQYSLKILDFGIAKRLEGSSRALTDPGRSLGSPWYMSPEQMLAASSVDQRADVWSLGVLLFELLTKELPFAGETVAQVCASVLTTPAPLVSQLRPDIDSGLDAVVLGCLEKEAAKRYQSVLELVDALRPFASEASGAALSLADSAVEPHAEPRRSRKRTFSSLAPLLTYGRRRTTHRIGSALVLLASGALLAGIGLPYLRAQQSVALPDVTRLTRVDLSRLRLPGDPLLTDGPLTTGSEPPANLEPVLLQFTTATAAPERSSDAQSMAGDAAAAEAELSPSEVSERAARYEQWLREQGLKRLDAVEPAQQPR